jgi:hypothetical protein
MVKDSVLVEISPGELIDKVTILEIKLARISDQGKLRNVSMELEAMIGARDRAIEPSAELVELTNQLRQVNESLWNIEDEIRLCERNQEFGPRFIELARSVYLQNDCRSLLKRKINEMLGASLVEEKAYTEYSRSGFTSEP